jgi:hypothetical protein
MLWIFVNKKAGREMLASKAKPGNLRNPRV